MKFYKHRLLSDAQLRKLSEHKYSCTSNSICDALLQGWWNWLVSKVPLWLAPNLITIVGLFVNVVTTLILVWYSPDAKQEPPGWACALCALGLFVYQSLDAIDGKQARRTGSANPLGELFDHGCDSISTVFVALSACTSVQLGYYPGWMFFQIFFQAIFVLKVTSRASDSKKKRYQGYWDAGMMGDYFWNVIRETHPCDV